jgi:hypothetical protein
MMEDVNNMPRKDEIYEMLNSSFSWADNTDSQFNDLLGIISRLLAILEEDKLSTAMITHIIYNTPKPNNMESNDDD